MKVLVIGDMCRDVYIYGTCRKMCPDAPIPVFVPTQKRENKGMAGNVYENLLSLSMPSVLISNDNAVIKTRYVEESKNHMLLRVDSGEESINRITGIEDFRLSDYDAVIISDYDKGYIHEDDIRLICHYHPLVFLDTKKIIGEYCKNCAFIKINVSEYERSFKDFKNPAELWAEDKMIVTLGSAGCMFKNNIYKVEKVEIRDTSGAGDTFLASLVFEYLQSGDIEKALKFANKCSTIVVQQKGVTVIDDAQRIL